MWQSFAVTPGGHRKRKPQRFNPPSSRHPPPAYQTDKHHPSPPTPSPSAASAENTDHQTSSRNGQKWKRTPAPWYRALHTTRTPESSPPYHSPDSSRDRRHAESSHPMLPAHPPCSYPQ